MTVPVWPTDLPQRFLQDGYSEEVADGRLRQTMDKGPTKVRRRTSAAVRKVSCSMMVDYNGRARFTRFWDEEVAFGALPFWVPDQFLDGAELATADGDLLLTEADAPILISSWWLVMFGDGAAAFAPIEGGRWRISFDLEILP